MTQGALYSIIIFSIYTTCIHVSSSHLIYDGRHDDDESNDHLHVEGCFKSLPPHKVIPCNPAPPFCCQNNFVCCRLLPPIVYTRSLEGTNILFGKGTRKSLSFLPGQPTMSKNLRIYSNFHNGDFFLMGFIFSGVSCSCELLRGFAHWYLMFTCDTPDQQPQVAVH